MSYIYELAKTLESSFTDCGVFAFNADAVLDGAIRNVSLATKEVNDRPWKRLQYYRRVAANIKDVYAKNERMWKDVAELAGSERASSVDGDDDAPPLTSREKSFSPGHRKPCNPLTPQSGNYNHYTHVFSKQDIEDFHSLHMRALAYTEAQRAHKAAQGELAKALKKHKSTSTQLESAVKAKQITLNTAHIELQDCFNSLLPRLFDTFCGRFLASVNELRKCFKLSPELLEKLKAKPSSDTPAATAPAGDCPEQVAAAPLEGVESTSGTDSGAPPAVASTECGSHDSAVEHSRSITAPCLESTEEVTNSAVSEARQKIWFRFFYFDRLKSATEKLSLALILCLLHFTRLEKKYDYAYPPALKAQMHHMLEVLNGYSWEKHRQRFDSILRDMFHYRKNLEHLRWASEELRDLDRKIEKHSGDVIKRKLHKYTERRVAVQKDVDRLTHTLFQSAADEMLNFYDALLTVVIKSLNDLVHLLHRCAEGS